VPPSLVGRGRVSFRERYARDTAGSISAPGGECELAACCWRGGSGLGLVNTAVADDPTLRPGDIVATNTGLMAYSAGPNGSTFMPISAYAGLSADLRRQLTETKIEPAAEGPAPLAPVRQATSAAARRTSGLRSTGKRRHVLRLPAVCRVDAGCGNECAKARDHPCAACHHAECDQAQGRDVGSDRRDVVPVSKSIGIICNPSRHSGQIHDAADHGAEVVSFHSRRGAGSRGARCVEARAAAIR